MYRSITKSIRDIIEKHGVKYENASVQIDLSLETAKQVIELGKLIPDDALYTEGDKYGRENDIHTTFLYGLKDSDLELTKKFFLEIEPWEIRFSRITPFLDSDKYIVLKIDVESTSQIQDHYKFRDYLLENGSKLDITHPTYHPHVTLGYVKKDFDYKSMIRDIVLLPMKVTELAFSKSTNDGKVIIPLKS